MYHNIKYPFHDHSKNWCFKMTSNVTLLQDKHIIPFIQYKLATNDNYSEQWLFHEANHSHLTLYDDKQT